MPYKAVRSHPKSTKLFLGAFVHMPYRIGHWAKAPKTLIDKGYGLAYFDSRRLAEQFARMYSGYLYVFECFISLEIGPPLFGVDMYHNMSLREIISNTSSITRAKFPPGTKMAEKIKLIKEIS